jgi:hypothetical protein
MLFEKDASPLRGTRSLTQTVEAGHPPRTYFKETCSGRMAAIVFNLYSEVKNGGNECH